MSQTSVSSPGFSVPGMEFSRPELWSGKPFSSPGKRYPGQTHTENSFLQFI